MTHWIVLVLAGKWAFVSSIWFYVVSIDDWVHLTFDSFSNVFSVSSIVINSSFYFPSYYAYYKIRRFHLFFKGIKMYQPNFFKYFFLYFTLIWIVHFNENLWIPIAGWYAHRKRYTLEQWCEPRTATTQRLFIAKILNKKSCGFKYSSSFFRRY